MSEPKPLRVVSLESRRSLELVRLFERHGCVAISAPSMREIPLEDQREAFAFGEQLMAGAIDVLVLLTGVGARVLVDALATRWSREAVLAALARTTLVCRGPKPVVLLKSLGLRPSVVAPEPNTWQDLLAVMDRELPVAGKRVCLQEYGRPSTALAAELTARGAVLTSVAVYAWAMPEDLGPLNAAIQMLCTDQADAVLFTSGRQIEHVLEAATTLGLADSLRTALRDRILVASMGPVTSEALRAFDVGADIEPVHPKMGHVVMAIAKDGARVLADKRLRAGAM